MTPASTSTLAYARDQFTALPLSVELADPISQGDVLNPKTAEALRHARLGNTDQALLELADLEPRDTAGHLTKGFLLSQLGRWGEAAQEFERVCDYDPQHPVANLNLGLTLLLFARPADAVLALRRHLILHPDDREARITLIEALLHAGVWHEAHGEIKRLLSANDNDREARLLLTRYLIQTGHREEAASMWEHRQEPEAYIQRLLLALEQDNRTAIEDNRQILAAQKLEPRVLKLVASAALHVADYQSAVEILERLIAMESSWEAWHNLAFAAQHAGDWTRAEEAYREALRIRPDAVESIANYANVLDRNGHSEAAQQVLLKAVEADPRAGMALWNLALMSERKADHDGSGRYFEQLTGIYPEWPEAWYRRGVAHLRADSFDAAALALYQALSLRPAWPEARGALILALLESGDTERAQYEINAAREEYLPQQLSTILDRLSPPKR